jgi:hypothetical protein
VKSLRGNAVFRWEYRPGSSLYLVWTQERSGYNDTGEFRMKQDFQELGDLNPNNVFLVKVTYYINP